MWHVELFQLCQIPQFAGYIVAPCSAIVVIYLDVASVPMVGG